MKASLAWQDICARSCHACEWLVTGRRARRFEWVDGPLTRAVEAGGWVLLDAANLCPATVLDRLNPLLEQPGGCLLLNEAGGGSDGTPRALRPHAAFRLILALDPRCASRPLPRAIVIPLLLGLSGVQGPLCAACAAAGLGCTCCFAGNILSTWRPRAASV